MLCDQQAGGYPVGRGRIGNGNGKAPRLPRDQPKGQNVFLSPFPSSIHPSIHPSNPPKPTHPPRTAPSTQTPPIRNRPRSKLPATNTPPSFLHKRTPRSSEKTPHGAPKCPVSDPIRSDRSRCPTPIDSIPPSLAREREWGMRGGPHAASKGVRSAGRR